MSVNKIFVNNSDSNYTHSIFDISEYTGISYDTLSDALDAVPLAKRKGGMTIRYVQTDDNNYGQFRYMGTEITGTPNPFLDTANWQGVDDKITPLSNNLAKSGEVYNSQYQKVVNIEGEGDIFKEVSLGMFEDGQKVFCHFLPWATTAASNVIFRIRKVKNGVNTAIISIYENGNIPTDYNFVAEGGAVYYFGGMADAGSAINGIFTYNCINENMLNDINQRILRNRDVVTYSGTNVIIDNASRTIRFDGNVVVINTQGLPTTLTTQNKQASFTAESTNFSGTTLAVLVFKNNNTLSVKQYDKLANDDYALIGLKFNNIIGNGTTPTTNTQVVSYSSVLPVKFGTSLQELTEIVNSDTDILNTYVIKRDTYPCPSADWNIYPRTLTADDKLYLTSSVVRTCFTLSSTSDSSSQYRLDNILLQANVKKTFNITQDAVAIMFYGKGSVIVDEDALFQAEIDALQSRQNREVIYEENSLPCPSADWNIYPMAITAGDTFYLTSSVARMCFTLSSTSSSGSQYRLDNIMLQANTKKLFVTTQDAVAIMFYGKGNVTLQKLGQLTKEVENLKKNAANTDNTVSILQNDDFNSLLRSVTQTVSKNTKLGGFLYVTDLHSDLESLKKMVAIKSALNLSSPMLNGGDIVGGYPRTEAGQATIDEYMQICEANNIYHVIGQHEIGFAPSSNPDAPIGRKKSDVYSNQETFNRYIAPLKSGWGLSSLDKCYYYKDFGNVRLITLYHYNRPEVDDPEDSDYYKYQRALVWYRTEQLQWFANTLGSMSSGQVAVILCHQPTNNITPLSSSKFQDGFRGWAPNIITTDDPITEIINAFKNKTQLVKTYTPTNTTKYLVSDGFEESVNIDFSTANGAFGFMIMGDNHYDAVGEVDGILCLCLTSSSNECTDTIITTNTGYYSDYIVNALGVKSDSVELGRVGQQYFCGVKRDIERLSYTQQ